MATRSQTIGNCYLDQNSDDEYDCPENSAEPKLFLKHSISDVKCPKNSNSSKHINVNDSCKSSYKGSYRECDSVGKQIVEEQDMTDHEEEGDGHESCFQKKNSMPVRGDANR